MKKGSQGTVQSDQGPAQSLGELWPHRCGLGSSATISRAGLDEARIASELQPVFHERRRGEARHELVSRSQILPAWHFASTVQRITATH